MSRLWGNFEGENVASGPLPVDAFQYPEYREMSWYAPEGDLAQDQRHRSSLWISYAVPKLDGLVLSVLQTLASGLPYGVGGGNPNGQIGFASNASVNAIPFVTNPGYVTPQGGSRQNYYFTDRDAFRTEMSRRTDFAANYTLSVGSGLRRIEGFVQAQVINIFNHQDLCGCGGTVFVNGGGVALNTIGSGVLTSINAPATLVRFNPFTETPVRGRQLELRAELRSARESIRVHLTADVPSELRRAVLEIRFAASEAHSGTSGFVAAECYWPGALSDFRLKAEATRSYL